MKNFRKSIATLSAAAFFIGLALSFNACTEQSPLQPANEAEASLAKRGNTGGSDGGNEDGNSQGENYPQFVSTTVAFQTDGSYQGGIMNVPGGSRFQVANDALTPPAETPYGADVTLTMEVKKVKYKGKEQLEFIFGPHGCVFSPRAEVVLDWTDLGINVANLYYIDESGNYVLQSPDQIDITNRKMTIYLDHFSRYAIGAE